MVGYRYTVFSGIFLLFLVFGISKVNGQCLQVNVGVIIDQEANPCDGPITLDAHYPGYNFSWNTGQATQKILVTKSDTYIVVVDDGAGCSGTDTVQVTFLPSPLVNLGPDPASQCGGCVTIDAGNTPGLTYQWSTGATTSSIKFCETGTNTVSVKVSNSYGCSGTDTVSVSITPGINVNLGNDISTCNEQVLLTTGLSGMNHVWSNGATSESITVSTSGQYFVDVNDGTGCVGSDTINVNFLPRPTVDLGTDPPSKCGGCVTLDAGETAGLNYLWSTGATSSSIQYCQTGTHEVGVQVTNSSGCSDRDTVNVTIQSGYDFSLGNDIAVCSGPVTIAGPSFAGATYLWNTGATTKDIQATTAGQYYVDVYDLPGCNASDILSDTINVIFENPLTTPIEIVDQTSCTEKKYSIQPVAGATSYTWTVPAGATIVSGQGTTSIIVQVNGNAIGTIEVKADNGKQGCTSNEASIVVNIGDHPINIPNAFSPNNDGTNDTWVIRNIELYPDNELVVLNRWGNEVYRTKNYGNEWDGSSLNEGTYFYKLKIRFCDTEKVVSEYVTIVR